MSTRDSEQAELTRQIAAELALIDPYGLRPGMRGWAPATEYDLEARDIAAELIENNAVSVNVVNEIWYRWFGDTLAEKVGSARVSQLVEVVNSMRGR